MSPAQRLQGHPERGGAAWGEQGRPAGRGGPALFQLGGKRLGPLVGINSSDTQSALLMVSVWTLPGLVQLFPKGTVFTCHRVWALLLTGPWEKLASPGRGWAACLAEGLALTEGGFGAQQWPEGWGSVPRGHSSLPGQQHQFR